MSQSIGPESHFGSGQATPSGAARAVNAMRMRLFGAGGASAQRRFVTCISMAGIGYSRSSCRAGGFSAVALGRGLKTHHIRSVDIHRGLARRYIRQLCGGAVAAAALAGASVSGCGSAPSRHVGTPGRSSSAVADPRCPVARLPGRDAPGHAVRAVFRHPRRLFGDSYSPSSRIFAALALDVRSGSALGINPRRYAARARRTCGATVAARTWAVFVELPEAPMASTAAAAVFVARTAAGWQPWYIVFPAAGTHGFLEP